MKKTTPTLRCFPWTHDTSIVMCYPSTRGIQQPRVQYRETSTHTTPPTLPTSPISSPLAAGSHLWQDRFPSLLLTAVPKSSMVSNRTDFLPLATRGFLWQDQIVLLHSYPQGLFPINLLLCFGVGELQPPGTVGIQGGRDGCRFPVAVGATYCGVQGVYSGAVA